MRLAQADRALQQQILDRCGSTEDALSEVRYLLCLAQKAIDGMVLLNDAGAIERMGKAQDETRRLIRAIDHVLPRQSRQLAMSDAAPLLAPLIDDFAPLIKLVASLDLFLSPTASMF
ncbi:hypothetical protein [Paraburkholderia sp. BL6665CI2N2]|uniref:hypothetical protein n=1 Tax=Paraburkholderia sp. BL6665CI2N2 TaxID=1938806 RepID=UPI001065086D|nr:hypothetical protein [Paraburkholderia sp. BL6665CI2N2]